jgi:thiopeptide-type bacteriocin biosynthesis protein
MSYVVRLAEVLERDRSVRPFLHYRPNPCLYRAAGKLRYVESRFEDGKRRHELAAIEPTAYLEATLACAKDGATFADLAAGLAVDGISAAEAESYINELIDAQVLTSDLAPAVTGDEPLPEIIGRLGKIPAASQHCRALEEVNMSLIAIDEHGIGASSRSYEAIAKTLDALPAEVERSRIVQVDMTKPMDRATIGPEVVGELLRAAELLRGMARRSPRDPLVRFRDAFGMRYEERDVPLLEALDEDLGLGFGDPAPDPSPLLKGLPLPRVGESSGASWSDRDGVLLRRLELAWSRGETEIRLEDNELEALKSDDAPPLPDTFAVLATLSESAAITASGDFRVFVKSVFGPSGASILGRFCHADAELHRRVSDHLRFEEQTVPEAIFAEVVHLGEGRIGNILLRPVLRSHEIPYLARSGAPDDRQISVTDLRVSIRAGRVVLRSDRLSREIVPRLTSAHNFSRSNLPVYRFLCALQGQGVASGLSWRWGDLESAQFLPRVSSGRAILSLARWTLDRATLVELGAREGVERFLAVSRLRSERGLPRHVVVSDGDNELPIDLDNVQCVDVFVHLVKNRESARLLERFPTPDELIAAGPEGRFVHELIVPFQKAGISPVVPDRVVTALDSATVRSLAPGSPWLYLKLYGPPSCQDQIVATFHREAVLPMLDAGLIDRWFFLRYADPDRHLRLRLRGASEPLLGDGWAIVRRVVDSFVRKGLVHRVQLDTYEREVERYGGPQGIEVAERMFHVDSDAAVEIIAATADEIGAIRWQAALRGMDALLDDLGFELPQKLELAKSARDGYTREFDPKGAMERAIGERFRAERGTLEARFAAPDHNDATWTTCLRSLARRSERLATIVADLRENESAGRLFVSTPTLARNVIHMNVNRLLRSSARFQEAILYNFLTRHYASCASRSKRTDLSRESIAPGGPRV